MKRQITGLVLIIIIGLSQIGFTQALYKIQENKNIDLILKGTSSMHDWEMEAYRTTGEAQFIFQPGSESELSSLQSLTFLLDVKDLKSDTDGLNENAYKALKSDEYQDICYKLSSSTISAEKNGYLIKSKGRLTIASVTKDILMDVYLVVNEDNTISCTGSYSLKMSDYQVEPPSFMWGAMKTGDLLTLDFNIVYNK